ncbi:MAG TPA: twin-arginine translocase subunit TatC [Gemmatimonadota bacterium]|nr:twin-arginine translocase subunit TatC [Gemmatimonadota bacterium]
MTSPRHPEATMSFLEHLEELRRRILWSLGAVVLGALVGFYVTTNFEVIAFLTRPVRPLLESGRLAYLHPTEPFMVTLKVGVFVGVLIALPVVFWHFWRFVAPGLMEREKKVFVPALVGSVGLFVGGAAMAFFFALPLALRFFFSFGEGALEPVITIGDYFSFAMRITLMFGLVFETPLVVIVLTYVGVLSPRTVRKYRRHVIAGMTIVSAIVTPADVFSMVLMLVPLYLLFELSVLAASLIERRREKRARRETAVPRRELPLEPGDA